MLGLDVGDARIGLAVSDPAGIISTPLPAIVRESPAIDLRRVADLAHEKEVTRIVVGLPLSMDGTRGRQARSVLRFCAELKKVTNRPVEVWDERLSTVEAAARLRQAGRKPSEDRSRLDSAAAALVLDSYLAAHPDPRR